LVVSASQYFHISQQSYGVEEIADVLDKLAFAYHFYRHTSEAYQQNLAVLLNVLQIKF